jgi:hypothetical protein
MLIFGETYLRKKLMGGAWQAATNRSGTTELLLAAAAVSANEQWEEAAFIAH